MKTLPLFLLLTLMLAACLPADEVSSEQPTPTARVALEATDPTTFVRAAGKPQLVEFFAFW
jgi:hypothetical protein